MTANARGSILLDARERDLLAPVTWSVRMDPIRSLTHPTPRRSLRVAGIIALLAAAAVAGPTSLVSAAPGTATDRGVLVGSCSRPRTSRHMPRTARSSDLSTDDVPAFAAHDGIREVSHTWFNDELMSTIFDFRFQFPDEGSAEAFLDDAEGDLGEVHNGSVSQVPPVSPLPDTRFYYFEDKVFGTDTNGFAFLMHHGNIAAKVWISGVDGNVSPSDAGEIAQAAADRMVKALGAEPVPTPGGSPGPSADPADVAELLSHVPAAVAADCVADDAEREAGYGELARVVCPQSDVASILFSLYDTEESLDSEFDVAVMVAQIVGWEPADSCEAGGYEGTWRLGEETAGRLLCTVQLGTANVVWSHPATRILSTIRQTDGDPEAAWQLWLAAGPE